MTPRILSVLVLVLVLCAASGCTSVTMFVSQPVGARVYVDGNFIGETPVSYSQRVSALTQNSVRLEAPAHVPLVTSVRADHWVGGRVAASVISGTFTVLGFFGLFWSTAYAPRYQFVLKPEVDDVSRRASEPVLPPPYVPPL